MKITLYSKTGPLPPEVEDYTRKKVNHLEHYLENGFISARIELEEDTSEHGGEKFRAEATIFMAGGELRAEAKATEYYEAVDKMMPKLKKQLEKYKAKKQENRK
ncbi:ribosome-associated translation inhibitor RaiA [Patescibacteria group bacterium]|nr:ribosome-associated translation inhibitor RaiA [Patescibacteria group bacterium]